MAFSFNPTQSTGQVQGAATAPTAPQTGMQPISSAVTPTSTLAVPDSPFYFIQQRGREKTVGAYVQLVLSVISFLTILSSITLFTYSFYLNMNIEKNKKSVLEQDITFKEYPFDAMKRLSLRFSVLGQMMKDYVSVRSPLRFLEDVVEKQVVFNDFSLMKAQTGSGYTISFVATTGNYRSLIQQLESLHLTQYKKITPDPKLDSFTDDTTALKIKVSTPVFVQGVLPDEIVFIQPEQGTTQIIVPDTTSSTTIATSTP